MQFVFHFFFIFIYLGTVAPSVHENCFSEDFSLKHNRRTDIPDKSLELVCIEIEPIKARPFRIFAWYRPPSALIESFKKLEGNLEFFDRENKEMIILGDTNCDFSSKVADEYSSSRDDLAAIYDLFGLTQMVGEPTKSDPNFINVYRPHNHEQA